MIAFCNSPGSPADKADLEVADEILEINGKALQNCSHTEVISHIHNVSKVFTREDKACHLVIHENFKLSEPNLVLVWLFIYEYFMLKRKNPLV